MDLKQLQYFVRVAEMGSFSRAAGVLSIAQPALSRSIRTLETELGQNLFLRTGRGVTLTDAGAELLQHALTILNQVRRARDTMLHHGDVTAGRVIMGLPPSIVTLIAVPFVEDFRARFPAGELAIVEGLSTHLVEWIQTGRVDMALVHNPEPKPEIDTQPVLEELLCLIGPRPNGAPPNRSPFDFANIDRTPLLLPERSHAIRRLLETRAAHQGVRLDIVMEISSVPAILGLVRRGIGHAILPLSALAQRETTRDYDCQVIVNPRLPCLLCLATPTHRPSVPIIDAAVPMLIDKVRAQIGQLEINTTGSPQSAVGSKP